MRDRFMRFLTLSPRVTDGRCRLVLTSSMSPFLLVRVMVMPEEIAAPFLDGLAEATISSWLRFRAVAAARNDRPA